MTRSRRLKLASLLAASLATAQLFGGQIVVDNSFGHAGALQGPLFSIPASLGRQAGGNLFHSFSTFDLGAGDVATFTAPAAVQNIFARVTGGTATTIDGKISAPANFYLINAQGVVFGPDAGLDIHGSFVVTTADVVKLAGGGRFTAAGAPAASVLTTAAPAAFGFLGHAPKPVAASGAMLAVPAGKALSIVAGSLDLSGTSLSAPAGAINIIAAASSGEARVNPSNLGAFPVTASLAKFADVTLSAASSLNCDGSGRINVAAGSVSVNASTISAAAGAGGSKGGIDLKLTRSLIDRGSEIRTDTFAGGDAGPIHVSAKSIVLDGAGAGGGPTDIASRASASAAGAAGTISLSCSKLSIIGAAEISSSTFGESNAGTVSVKAARTITLEGDGAVSTFEGIASTSQNAGAGGAAGDVRVSAGSLMLSGASNITSNTKGLGRAGDVTVNVAHTLAIRGGTDNNISTFISSDSDNATTGGPAGKVTVYARTILGTNNSAISSQTFGSGDGGSVSVTAGRMQFSGVEQPGIFASSVGTNPFSGPGGSVHVHAAHLALLDTAQIDTQSMGGGTAGDAVVDAQDLTLSGASAIRSSNQGSGNGGNVSVNAGDQIRLRNGATVAAFSAQAGAGDVRIVAGRSVLLNAASVDTNAAGAGGSIHLTAPTAVELRNGSQITSNSVGINGGDIAIDPVALLLVDSGIHANGGDSGGTIKLLADKLAGVFTSGPRTDVTATGGTGTSGSILAIPEQLDIAGSLVLLQAGLATPATLIPQCGVKLGGNQSSFVVSGRGGSPVEPGAWQPEFDLTPVPARADDADARKRIQGR